MKVYIIMSGWDNHDEEPSLREVFAIRDDAVKLIEKKLEEHHAKELISCVDAKYKVRKKVSHDRWAIEIYVLNDYWVEDMMWIIKKREVL